MRSALAVIETEQVGFGGAKDPAMMSLARHIDSCYSTAKMAKQEITERLLRCDRQRRGEYDPEKAAAIKATGGSEVYLMLTDIKCRAAESWIKDVMLSAGEEPFKVEHTKIPEIHPSIEMALMQGVMQDAQALMEMGYDLTPEMVREQAEFITRKAKRALADEADRATEAMNAKIIDILQEAGWSQTAEEIISDFVTYPFCVFKNERKRRKVMKWGQGWTPNVVEEVVHDFRRISPYDAFWSPGATGPQEGFFIVRHRLQPRAIEAMKGVDGYNDTEIESVLYDHRNGLRVMDFGDTERDRMHGVNSFYNTGDIEAIEFWGDAHGSMLQEWGMRGIDENRIYQINAWKVGSRVIMAQLNSDPLGRRPYSKACWSSIPGSFVGRALPETMRDIQELCNNSARSLANNMSVASGPQVEVTVDRLPAGERVTQLFPWKVWQTTSDRTGGGQPAIRFFQPDMNAGVLLEVLQYFTRIADEVTGVPNYIYGSTNVSGAGRTASGLSMLMDNASKGIKQAILSLDKATNEMLTRLYEWLMLNDPDERIKGDMKIVPAGVVGALIKDHVQEKRQLFLQAVSNPIDQGIIGIKGRVELLREMAKGLHLDIDKVLPPPDVIEQMHQSGNVPPELQAQLQQLQQMLGQAQQQLADKSADYELRREEIGSRVDIARITAAAQIDGRMQESAVRAQTDQETRIHVAKLDRETKLMVKEIDERMNSARLEHEANQAPEPVDQEKVLAPVIQAIQQLSQKVQQLSVEPEKEEKEQTPVVINLSVDAKTGNVKKEVKVVRDPSGRIVSANVEEREGGSE